MLRIFCDSLNGHHGIHIMLFARLSLDSVLGSVQLHLWLTGVNVFPHQLHCGKIAANVWAKFQFSLMYWSWEKYYFDTLKFDFYTRDHSALCSFQMTPLISPQFSGDPYSPWFMGKIYKIPVTQLWCHHLYRQHVLFLLIARIHSDVIEPVVRIPVDCLYILRTVRNSHIKVG